MMKRSKPSMKSKLFVAPLMVVLLLGSTRPKAQRADTTKKPLLASLNKKAGKEYIVKPANVEFPEILKGNEAQTLDYIERFSERRRAYILRMHAKGKKLLPQAATILEKYNLPTELKVLLTLESAYNANAVSRAGAVGYWQIMDEVAKEYGM